MNKEWIDELAERHFLRGGKFVMACERLMSIGEISKLSGDFLEGETSIFFRVVEEATFSDMLSNRPVELLGTPCEDTYPYYYFVEPCD